MDFNKGGQEVIKRLLIAYGFKTRQALCTQLGASTSTMSTRWMRDIFPADWVIQCSIETGASLAWLSFGQGEAFENEDTKSSKAYPVTANENLLNDVVSVPCKKIIDGNLYNSNFYMLDKSILPEHINKPLVIAEDDVLYLADLGAEEVSDGTWLVEIEGKTSIKELTRVPVGRVRVAPRSEGYAFECAIEDIKPLAKCHNLLIASI